MFRSVVVLFSRLKFLSFRYLFFFLPRFCFSSFLLLFYYSVSFIPYVTSSSSSFSAHVQFITPRPHDDSSQTVVTCQYLGNLSLTGVQTQPSATDPDNSASLSSEKAKEEDSSPGNDSPSISSGNGDANGHHVTGNGSSNSVETTSTAMDESA